MSGVTATIRLRKRLSATDAGESRSHQAGIFVPPAVVSFFPPLRESDLNPDRWITVIGANGAEWRWRFVHYNNRIVGAGTRNEYRLCHTTPTMRSLGARSGDEVELERVSTGEYALSLAREDHERKVLVLSVDGPWRTVSIPRP